ncbi:MAG: EAL domain-containing response regulator [Spirochaetia bacterium]|nr:EAL domain-containing response regulator [Spirochaetia bacterium]
MEPETAFITLLRPFRCTSKLKTCSASCTLLEMITEVGIQRILVVDDSPMQRQHALEQCRKLGIPGLFEAENGLEAWNLLSRQDPPPEALILDLEMPVMDGIELIQKIHKAGIDIPILILSSREPALVRSVESLLHSLGQNSLGSQQKPVQLENLRAALSKVRPKTEPRVSNPAGDEPLTGEDLFLAIEQKEIIPYFQPKVSLLDGKLCGVEALARWRHPLRGLIGPDVFIPLAEKSKYLIKGVTLAVIEESMRQRGLWKNKGIAPHIAINLSAVLLTDPGLPEWLGEWIADPSQIIFELTEGSYLSKESGALGTLARLRLKGFGLSIDDYGTGFSSMQQLSRIDFTELKVDRSFVKGVHDNERLSAILRSAVDVATRLNISAVAEGVEDGREWAHLSAVGCSLAQGYFIARPMPGDELVAWAKDRNLASLTGI